MSNKDNDSNILVNFITILGMVIVFIYFALVARHMTAYAFDWGKCKASKIIKTIGGCDSSAKCAVQFEDGSYGEAVFPVIGKNECVERSLTEFDEDSFPMKIRKLFNGRKKLNSDKKVKQSEVDELLNKYGEEQSPKAQQTQPQQRKKTADEILAEDGL